MNAGSFNWESARSPTCGGRSRWPCIIAPELCFETKNVQIDEVEIRNQSHTKTRILRIVRHRRKVRSDGPPLPPKILDLPADTPVHPPMLPGRLHANQGLLGTIGRNAVPLPTDAISFLRCAIGDEPLLASRQPLLAIRFDPEFRTGLAMFLKMIRPAPPRPRRQTRYCPRPRRGIHPRSGLRNRRASQDISAMEQGVSRS